APPAPVVRCERGSGVLAFRSRCAWPGPAAGDRRPPRRADKRRPRAGPRWAPPHPRGETRAGRRPAAPGRCGWWSRSRRLLHEGQRRLRDTEGIGEALEGRRPDVDGLALKAADVRLGDTAACGKRELGVTVLLSDGLERLGVDLRHARYSSAR